MNGANSHPEAMAGIHTGRRGYPAGFVGALFLYALWVTESRTMLPGGDTCRATFYFLVPGLDIVKVEAAASVAASGGTAWGSIPVTAGIIGYNSHTLSHQTTYWLF